MNPRILFPFLLFVLTVFDVPPSLSPPPLPAVRALAAHEPDSALVEALHRCVLERFRRADMVFGGARIDTPYGGMHRFQPQNARELEAASALERAGLQVVIYLSGRALLHHDAASGRPSRRAFQGPYLVSLVDRFGADHLPRATDLMAEARAAFTTFQKDEARDFESGTWQFAARPIRAHDQSCLRCHNRHVRGGSPDRLQLLAPAPDAGLGLGDTLGVVLYGYRRP
jgi:hypothetical protein